MRDDYITSSQSKRGYRYSLNLARLKTNREMV